VPPVSEWLRVLHRELRRGRHVVLHGAVEDQVKFGSEYIDLRAALSRFLPLAGVEWTAFYDPVDGLTFPTPEAEGRFHELRRGSSVDPPTAHTAAEVSQHLPAEQQMSDRDRRLAEVQAQAAQIPTRSKAPRLARLEDALPAIRAVLHEPSSRFGVVIEMLDLVLDPSLHAREERAVYAQLRLIMREAACGSDSTSVAAGFNPLILVVGDLRRIPPWLHDQENPRVATVRVSTPSLSERRDFLLRMAPRFFNGDQVQGADLAVAADAFANLTEDMTACELHAAQLSSHIYRVPPTRPRELLQLHQFGPHHDRWESFNLDTTAAATFLNARVLGQPAAIAAVIEVLNAACVGLELAGDGVQPTRPRGTFLFLGPTGVGKTELAKGLAELIFDDERAIERFDMSEYGQAHDAARLIGSPPGYIGHDQGGALTNAVLENPFRILLFDEIDKAHPEVLNRFLQVLDDGRLTDGSGRTAHFNQSVIVFTSNEGSASLPTAGTNDPEATLPSYEDIRRHFDSAVRHRIGVDLRKPEFVGRLGDGILVFDILRAEAMPAITFKFLNQLAASAAARYRVRVAFAREEIASAIEATIFREGTIGSGGRQIRTEVDRFVRRPLSRWWTEHRPVAGSSIRVTWPPDSEEIVISLDPHAA
jgi:ATP-dependent Clp protease ATP-binding subunit ClpA